MLFKRILTKTDNFRRTYKSKNDISVNILAYINKSNQAITTTVIGSKKWLKMLCRDCDIENIDFTCTIFLYSCHKILKS